MEQWGQDVVVAAAAGSSLPEESLWAGPLGAVRARGYTEPPPLQLRLEAVFREWGYFLGLSVPRSHSAVCHILTSAQKYEEFAYFFIL